MSTYRLDYVRADLAAGIELVVDSREFSARDDTAAMSEATRLLSAWGKAPAGERRTGRLRTLADGRNGTFIGNVWQR